MWNALALHNSIPEITRPRRVADYRVRHILPKPSFRFDQSKATGWRVLGAQSLVTIFRGYRSLPTIGTKFTIRGQSCAPSRPAAARLRPPGSATRRPPDVHHE